MQGTIHRLIRGKGFGFIVNDDRQYFFHHTEVRDIEFKELAIGDVVTFNAVEDEGGRNPRAVEVTVIEKKPKPPRPAPPPRQERPAPAPRPQRRPRPQGGGGGRPWQPRTGAGPGGGNRRRAPVREQSEFGAGLGVSRDEEFVENLSSRHLDDLEPAPRRSPPKERMPREDSPSRRPRISGTAGERSEGVVRAINAHRGFGFIETPSGDIFFHRSSVRDGFENLSVGSRVSFTFMDGDRGSKANDVAAM